MDKATYDRSQEFWKLALNYLNLVRASLGETIKHENPDWVISSDPISDEAYDNQTRWSDFNILVPLLFNFYHGLELILKGFVLLQHTSNQQLDHKLKVLFKKFSDCYPAETELRLLFSKYIQSDFSPKLLDEFFKENKCSTDKFYELLKYPCDKQLAVRFNHLCLKYRGQSSTTFFKEINKDIGSIIQYSVGLARLHEPSLEATFRGLARSRDED